MVPPPKSWAAIAGANGNNDIIIQQQQYEQKQYAEIQQQTTKTTTMFTSQTTYSSTTFQIQSLSPEPTQRELSDLSEAIEKLWNIDYNRLQPGKDFELNIQNTTRISNGSDRAFEPLFKKVDPHIFRKYPTYSAFYALLDNYVATAGVRETDTPQERAEKRKFLDEFMKTAPGMYIHRYLVHKRLVSPDVEAFKMYLHDIWFKFYRRLANNDSSAFEHCFVGEARDEQVIGFHNWIQFFVQERKGHADYRGWIMPRRRSSKLAEVEI
ncbi:hypothetical protein HK102_007222 [Quaeritorhiza haematococci]|nr:hypothetical protein HK102_007222 [Quaeritorhiza haematococci]